jgi:Right handed beta helix region
MKAGFYIRLLIFLFCIQLLACKSTKKSMDWDWEELTQSQKSYKGVSSKKAKYKVQSVGDLYKAIRKVKKGEIIYLHDNRSFDLTEYAKLELPEGVTLASGRGQNGSKGALILVADLARFPMIEVKGNNVRISGIRLQGPDTLRRTDQMRELNAKGRYYDIPNSSAIGCTYETFQLDNCEIYGWSHSGIYLNTGANDAIIRYNYFHHNQRSGLGYGVCLNEANALIIQNVFDYYRHAVNGTGRPGTSYEAAYNILLKNASGHAFDMHGGFDRKERTNIAGTYLKVHHNKFYLMDYPGIFIRGVPEKEARIYNNHFENHTESKMAIKLLDEKTVRIKIRNNFVRKEEEEKIKIKDKLDSIK